MYYLIAFDLDGTLVDDSLHIRPRVRDAVRSTIARGVHVTLATGRAFPSIAGRVGELGITAPVICYQGGLVKDPVSGARLFEVTMPRDLAGEAVQLAQADHLHLMLYLDDEIYVTDLHYDPEFYARWFSLPLHVVPDLTGLLDRDPTKFIIIAKPEVCDRLHPAWKAHFDGRLQIVRSHRLFVEGNPLDVSKGRALAFVAGCLGVPREATIAVGDNDNDRTMIEWAGLGVAMGNAPAELQAVADYVAPPVDEDGAAEVLERFVLHE
jgi:Cof subfamily protein (haloacid dehalogenase superfamily)